MGFPGMDREGPARHSLGSIEEVEQPIGNPVQPRPWLAGAGAGSRLAGAAVNRAAAANASLADEVIRSRRLGRMAGGRRYARRQCPGLVAMMEWFRTGDPVER